VQVKVDEEVVVSEEDPGDGSSAKVIIEEEKVTISTGPFAVSDAAWEAAKDNPVEHDIKI
jgi:hypothetical protein